MYDVNYFIKKFEAIPDEFWCVGLYFNLDTDKRCAMGHCGARSCDTAAYTDEASALSFLFRKYLHLYPQQVNDRAYDDLMQCRYSQPHPRQRILAALREIKLLIGEEKGTATVEEFIREGELCIQ